MVKWIACTKCDTKYRDEGNAPADLERHQYQAHGITPPRATSTAPQHQTQPATK